MTGTGLADVGSVGIVWYGPAVPVVSPVPVII